MLVRKPQAASGLTDVAPLQPESGETGLGFGLIRLARGQELTHRNNLERAFFLLAGDVEVAVGGGRRRASRRSLVNEMPTVVHVPRGEPVVFTGEGEESELVVFEVVNDGDFTPRIIGPSEVDRSELVSDGLAGSTRRELRTVLDSAGAPHSRMTVGELVNLPGRWSSYPPHVHPHPEIYHYRFIPGHGFGYSQVGEEVFVVRDGDTVLIPPFLAHPQVAAPGFAMLYVWGMPHLPTERFGPESRRFQEGYDGLRDEL